MSRRRDRRDRKALGLPPEPRTDAEIDELRDRLLSCYPADGEYGPPIELVEVLR